MNIETVEVITILNSKNWRAQMLFDAMAAQGRLMNGKSQFSPEENRNAEATLEKLVITERRRGNHRLEAIYQNALNQVRRGY